MVQSYLILPLKQQYLGTAFSFRKREPKSSRHGQALVTNSLLSTPVWVSWSVCWCMPTCTPRKTLGQTEREGNPNAGSTVPSPGVKNQPFCSQQSNYQSMFPHHKPSNLPPAEQCHSANLQALWEPGYKNIPGAMTPKLMLKLGWEWNWHGCF